MGLCVLVAGCDRDRPRDLATRIPPRLAQPAYPPRGWAWGRLNVPGAPPVRYGVAPPARAAKAEVLILPDAGEPAEAWFETANALIARGEVVWILDLVGQGGSARRDGAGDRLYATSLDPDVSSVRALVGQVIRPGGRSPLVLVAKGLGAQIALRALADGLPGVEGAALEAPALSPRPLRLGAPFGDLGADVAGRLGFGRPYLAGEHGWRPPASGAGEPTQAWMQANPRLRIGGASLAWAAAYNRSAAAARSPARLAKIDLPVLMTAEPGDATARSACLALPACRFEPVSAASRRDRAWLAKVQGFVEVRARGHAIGAAPVPP